MKIERVGLYARVSTMHGQDPNVQLRELREYCLRRGFEIAEEFVDKGISGSRERRPALCERPPWIPIMLLPVTIRSDSEVKAPDCRVFLRIFLGRSQRTNRAQMRRPLLLSTESTTPVVRDVET